ncbi:MULTISPECIES: PadR family transcriptional regulator [Bacillales]|uniref:PadR family transcriptional regulator n=1 Tax=Lysinibacillus louembei TaxID=1470088 RepID=A0ABZ0RWW4_9BACI|nr:MULTISPECIES: PadR family transcriptional regulator [Bacillales]MCT6922596.1 PadR family transcriptional regulator [Metasolibacillus sp.]MCT6939065.1 PadR family transcriptional regulator [Metasolibacillus sp.]WPK11509.1 PadR family transcriptional regulator [Lysinibacillus louembei]
MSSLIESFTTELRRGTLTLAVLSQLETPQYGYSLVERLEQAGVSIEQNTLYPLLRRLEKQELVTSSWDTSESRPRKYYVISDYGREIFEQLKLEWLTLATELTTLLQGGHQS